MGMFQSGSDLFDHLKWRGNADNGQEPPPPPKPGDPDDTPPQDYVPPTAEQEERARRYRENLKREREQAERERPQREQEQLEHAIRALSGLNGRERAANAEVLPQGSRALKHVDQMERLEAGEYAKQKRAEEQAALLRADRRPIRTMREAVKEPVRPSIIDGVLAVEGNGLSGKGGQGKSMLAREWSLCVASGMPWRGHVVPEPRNVLWVATEGLHDRKQRWESQPLWDAAADRVFPEDDSVNLYATGDVDWLLERYGHLRPGLVVFDLIYGNWDEKDPLAVSRVIAAMRRISQEWGAATLAVGHTGLHGERRFRYSSLWRDRFFTDWHMADGLLTCEKSKIADPDALGVEYVADYPNLRWLEGMEGLQRSERIELLIEEDIKAHPDDTDTARARRLKPQTEGMSEGAVRKRIARHRKDRGTTD